MAKKTTKKKKTPAKKAAAKKTPAKKTPVKKKAADPKKKVAATPKAKKKTSKKRTRAGKEIRLKAFWGVFNQSLKRVALFEFNEKKKAEKKAEELSKGGKSPHFIQPVKEMIDS